MDLLKWLTASSRTLEMGSVSAILKNERLTSFITYLKQRRIKLIYYSLISLTQTEEA